MKNTRNFKSLSIVLFAIAIWFWPLSPQLLFAQQARQMLEKLDAFPDLIAFNGKIATLDSKMTTVQAMAVRKARIIVLGTDSEIKALAGPKTQMLDLKGRMVLPGLIDSHTHPHAWGVPHFAYKYDPQLKFTYIKGSPQEIKDALGPAITKRAQELGPDKWIIIHIPRSTAYTDWNKRPLQRAGSSAAALTGPNFLLTREELDAIAPNNPVVVFASALGGTVTTTRAKQIMEQKLGKELTSLRLWYFLFPELVLPGKYEAIGQWLKEEMIECNAKYGVTTVGTHIEPQGIIKALNMLELKGDMPIRWAWVHRTAFSLAKDPVEFYRLLGDSLGGKHGDYFWPLGVGSEGWDKGDCTTMVARDPKLREIEANPNSNCNRKDSTDYLAHLAAIEKGARITHLHAFRDKSLDWAIEMFEQAMREANLTLDQVRQIKLGFDHAAIVRPELAPKLAKYGILLNFNTVYTWELGHDLSEVYGEQYLKWLSPVKSMVDAGAPFVISTDAHITRIPEEVEHGGVLDWPWGNTIWPFIGSFVHRKINGRLFNPQEKIDRVTAIKAHTIWAADYVDKKDDLGSLEAGKLADFIAIDRDYFTIPEEDIDNIKTLMTVVGGKTLFRSPEF